MCIYTEEGYKNRKDYLLSLSENYGVDLEITLNLASMFGEDEDFDGLIVALEDI